MENFFNMKDECYLHQIEVTNKNFSEDALEELEVTFLLHPQRALAYAFSIGVKLNEVFHMTTEKGEKYFIFIEPGGYIGIKNSVTYKCNHELGGKCAINPNCKLQKKIPFISASLFPFGNKQYTLLHLIEKPMCKNTIYFEIAETIKKR